MTKKELKKTIEELMELLDGTAAERASTSDLVGYQESKFDAYWHVRRHCAWMLTEMGEYLEQGQLDKVQRWVGFIQGALWAVGHVSIDTFREMNRKKAS